MYRSKKLLCLLTAGLLLSACGETAQPVVTSSSDDTSVNATEGSTALTDGLPDKDMEGFELNMIHHDGSWLSWAEVILDAESENGDLLNDAVYKRNRRIEERFGCGINITDIDSVTPDMVRREATSGDSTYDVWFMYDLQVISAADCLTDWNTLPYVNLDSSWWNPLATGIFDIGGKQYAAAGNYSLSVLSRATGYIFNKDIYKTLNSDIDMYRLAADGRWTIDKMAQIAKQAASDLNGDAKMDQNDRYGINGSWKGICARAILGSGVSFIATGSDGYPEFSLPKNEAAIDRIIKIYDTFCTDPEIYAGRSADNVDGLGENGDFKSGKSLFSGDTLFGLESMRDLYIDIGFVPCPKFDEEQDHYYAPSYGAELSVILKTVPEERLENIGILLEALAFDSQESLIPSYRESVIKTKSARDDESAAMIDIIVDSISFEFGLNAWQNTVFNPFVRQTFAAGNSNFASTLASMQSTVNDAIEKLKVTLG